MQELTQVCPSATGEEPDQLLIERAQQRMRGGATLLYARYVRLVKSTLRRFVNDRAMLEDLTQETFSRAFHALAKLNDVSKLKGWLASIARRASLDHRDRLSVRVSELPASAVEPDEVERAALSTDDVEARLRTTDVKQQLERLAPPYREALVLKYFDGLTVPEIAQRLAIGEPLAKYRLRHGLELLRAIWSGGLE